MTGSGVGGYNIYGGRRVARDPRALSHLRPASAIALRSVLTSIGDGTMVRRPLPLKPRPCLGCQKQFQPEGRFNRFCPDCQRGIRSEPRSVRDHLSKRDVADVAWFAAFG